MVRLTGPVKAAFNNCTEEDLHVGTCEDAYDDFLRALQMWSYYEPDGITLRATTDTDAAQVEVGFGTSFWHHALEAYAVAVYDILTGRNLVILSNSEDWWPTEAVMQDRESNHSNGVNVERVIAHELGHHFGLNDRKDARTGVMSYAKIYRPMPFDCADLRSLEANYELGVPPIIVSTS